MVLFLAFSLQAEVEKYGAYVGIAAFFGLAVLALLYFSQARELKRLREWAGRAPERAQEIEARAIAQAEETRRLQAQPVAVAAATAGAHAASAGAAPATQVLEENGQAGNGTAAAAEEHENGAVTTAPQDRVEVTGAGEAAQLIEPDIPVAGGDDGEPAEAQADGAAEAVDGAVAASERAEADGGVAAVEAPAA